MSFGDAGSCRNEIVETKRRGWLAKAVGLVSQSVRVLQGCQHRKRGKVEEFVCINLVKAKEEQIRASFSAKFGLCPHSSDEAPPFLPEIWGRRR